MTNLTPQRRLGTAFVRMYAQPTVQMGNHLVVHFELKSPTESNGHALHPNGKSEELGNPLEFAEKVKKDSNISTGHWLFNYALVQRLSEPSVAQVEDVITDTVQILGSKLTKVTLWPEIDYTWPEIDHAWPEIDYAWKHGESDVLEMIQKPC
jgi:hypothetical protein